MNWYIVLLDVLGTQHQAIQFDHKPTESDEHEYSQMCGYVMAGVIIASCGDDAIAQVESEFDGGGCVS